MTQRDKDTLMTPGQLLVVNSSLPYDDRLALAIDAAVEKAVAAERERCAKIADEAAEMCQPCHEAAYVQVTARGIAARIRVGGGS